MKAKKVMTKGEDGVVKLLKEAENISANPHSKSSVTESLQKWASLDGENNIPSNNVYSENKHSLDNTSLEKQQKDYLIYGNPSFLSRFIESRNYDKVPFSMTTDNQKEKDQFVETKCVENLENSAIVDNQLSIVKEGKEEEKSNMTEIIASNHADIISEDKLSQPDIDNKASSTKSSDISSKQCAKSSVANHSNEYRARRVQVKVSSTRRVEEIRKRIEGNVENSRTSKECRSPVPRLKSYKVDFKSKPISISKEECNKTEIRRHNSNTRDSPPRKVSFKVRNSINNGKMSSSLSSSRRLAASKITHTDTMSSSKVAALASKFNKIIDEKKESGGLSSDYKKKSMSTPQLAVDSTKNSDVNSLISKKESSERVRKLSSSDTTQFSSPRNNLKEESVTPSKPISSVPIRKNGNIKAALEFFEKSSIAHPASVNSSRESAKDGGKSVGNSKTQESELKVYISEVKREPNYPRTHFKRDSTLVHVKLEFEDVLAFNEDLNSKKETNTKSEIDELPISVQDETEMNFNNEYKTDVGDINTKNDSRTQIKSGYEENITDDRISEQERESPSRKVRPAVPPKSAIKDRMYKSLLDLRNGTDEDNYVKVSCKTDKVKDNESKTDEISENLTPVPEKQVVSSESYSNRVYELSEVRSKETPPVIRNKSFLWSVSPPSSSANTPESSPSTYTAVPAIVTKDDERTLEQINDESSVNELYDDVYPPSSVYSTDTLQGYSVIKPQEDLYDDVGLPVSEDTTYSILPEDNIVTSNNVEEETENVYELCGVPQEPELDQTYDDCIGEGYQFISQSNGNEDAESNIYDDVKSVTITDDTRSISNCYESIYSGGDRLDPGGVSAAGDTSTSRNEVPSSASSSVGSGNHSFCDQSNSLYGIGGSKFDSASLSQASTVSADYGPHEAVSYHLKNMIILRQPRSETSDEWVDDEMTNSEGEGEYRHTSGYYGRTRNRRSHRKSRKIDTVSARSAPGHGGGAENSSDSDANYPGEEMIYEEVDPKNEMFYDDFDSTNSDISDETYTKGNYIANGQLPEPPTGQSISKIGKKVLKTFRRIKNKRHSSPEVCPPLPSRPPPPSLPSRPPPQISNKTISSRNLSGRKYWSLRKFKRSSSVPDQVPLVPSSGGSTFYISHSADVNDGSIDNNSVHRRSVDSQEFSENGETPTSPSSVSSDKTIIYQSGMEGYSSQDKLQRDIIASINSRNKKSRSSGSIHPHSPPPLPPKPKKSDVHREYIKSGSTLCHPDNDSLHPSVDTQNDVTNTPKNQQTHNISWYADADIMYRSTSSPNDSSLSEQDARSQLTELSGGDSSLSARSPEYGSRKTGFPDEPLYQFYDIYAIERDQRSERYSDEYEEIAEDVQKQQSHPTSMGEINTSKPHPHLWSEHPNVTSTNILSMLTPQQKKLQEAKYEIISSEASYYKSLDILEKHFMSSPEINNDSILSRSDRKTLFANVMPVKICSERFLEELEECWRENILLYGICDIVCKHATENFSAYVKYCADQNFISRRLDKLKEREGFAEVLRSLESDPVCQAQSLYSFLMLPMQRITRLPLLIDAVLKYLGPENPEYESCRLAYKAVHKIAQECNDSAEEKQQHEEVVKISQQLDFPKEMKSVFVLKRSRRLVKSGEFTQFINKGDDKRTFGKKFSKQILHLFLFNDLLLVTTRKKSEDLYRVIDFCPRNMVQMADSDGTLHIPPKHLGDGNHNLMVLTLLENHEKKTVEMILSCQAESDKMRWLEAVKPPVSENPNETVYEDWDCPQVRATYPYVACQPDELSLNVGDVVNVHRKNVEGWCQGERIRDGQTGWFPVNFTTEIESAHVRARNLKQRHRLLSLSAKYLESQFKEKQTK